MPSPVIIDLNNFPIGQYGLKCSIRFVPRATIPVVAERHYVIDNDAAGYSLGSHGSIVTYLCTDSRGFPDRVLGKLVHIDDPAYPDPSSVLGRFPLHAIDGPPVLCQAGVPYHFMLVNEDPDSQNNYQSIDLLIPGAGQAEFSDMQFLFVEQGDGSWHKNDGVIAYMLATPFMVFGADGQSQGYGWYEKDPANLGKALWATEYGFGPAQ